MNFKLKKLVLGSLIPIIAVATSISANFNDNINGKANKNSNENLSQNAYNALKVMYEGYYKKMNIERNIDNFVYDETKDDYNKVGIIDVDDINENLLISKDKNFTFNKLNVPYRREDSHGEIVTSIIGTDMGINPNANIYYAGINFIDKNDDNALNIYSKLDKAVAYMAENNVNIVNLSLKIFDEIISPSIDNNRYDDFFSKEDIYSCIKREILKLKYYNKSLSELDSLYSRFVRILNKYAIENDMTFVVSAGNDRNTIEMLRIWLNNNFSSLLNDISNHRDIELFKILSDNMQIIKNIMNNDSETINKINDLNKKILKAKTNGNIIIVGSVNADNKHSEFSEYSDEIEGYPLISAYGDYFRNDDKYINDKFKREELLKKIMNEKISDKMWNKAKYAQKFNGTSMSAPMITGLLSLIQSTSKKRYTVSDFKAILAASSKLADYSTSYGENDSIRYTNMSKQRTGFGIPNYELAETFIKRDRFLDINRAITNYDYFLEDDWILDISNLAQDNLYKDADSSNIITLSYKNITFNEFIEQYKENFYSKYKALSAIITYLGNKKIALERNNPFDLSAVAEIEFTYPNYYSPDYFYPETNEYTRSYSSRSKNAYVEKMIVEIYENYDDNEYENLEKLNLYIELPELKELKEVVNKMFNYSSEKERRIIFSDVKSIYFKYLESMKPSMIVGGI
ncbi:S8 family serine peptidase [Mycoplasma sp. 48589B]